MNLQPDEPLMKLLLTAVTIVGFVGFSVSTQAIEKPHYETLYQDGKIEYRLYAPYVVAQTTVAAGSSYGRAATKGFMRLFDYISGDNTSTNSITMTAPVQQKSVSEKIDMTAPVQQSIAGDNGWAIAFMLPGEYSLDTAPKPNNELVTLRQIPSRLMAVITYSGRWTQRNFDKYSERLKTSVENAGIDVLSTAESAVYNPPFTPPFMRRNEIQIKVNAYPGMALTQPTLE